MAVALSQAMVAAVLADAADQRGVTVPWLVSQQDVLAELGLDPAIVTQSVVHYSQRVFRKAIDLTLAPYKAPPSVPVTGEETSSDPALDTLVEAPQQRKRGKIPGLFGYSMTAVLRALGKEGWSFEDAWLFCGDSRVGAKEISKSTVKCQLYDGKSGKNCHGEPAPLTAKQIKWCLEIIK